jgi:hypothetical protein
MKTQVSFLYALTNLIFIRILNFRLVVENIGFPGVFCLVQLNVFIKGQIDYLSGRFALLTALAGKRLKKKAVFYYLLHCRAIYTYASIRSHECRHQS